MQNVIEDSEECCLGLLTEWKKTSVQVQKSVDSFSERCDKQEAQETARNAKLE